MTAYSVIVTAHNLASLLPRTLQSVATAIAFCQHHTRSAAQLQGEVVVVDDGSTDDTWPFLQRTAAANPMYRIVRRARSSSPSCARNAGVAASCGDLLFFLDGDDLFLPAHICACCQALQDPLAQFVKTGVRLADPVHPDWARRIRGSLAINLCVRRRCHLQIGGFPDWHLFLRQGDFFSDALDLFYKYEDQYYNMLLGSLFRGVEVLEETVQYVRYPGNSYDRQYPKFCQPFGTYVDNLTPEVQFRLDLCQRIVQERIRVLKAQGCGSQPLPSSGDSTAKTR